MLHALSPTSLLNAPLPATLQEEDISALEDASRNRLAGRRGASGKAERLAAKKSLFSRDEWSHVRGWEGDRRRRVLAPEFMGRPAQNHAQVGH